MNHETHPIPQTPLEPTKENVTEMSFGVALRRAIDDLFTHQTIAEKVQAIPPNEVLPALLETWKQGLANHLQTEAQFMVTNVAAILNLLQGENEAISVMEPLEWQQLEHAYAPFPMATICREDLHNILPEEVTARFSDDEMSRVAAQMGEALRHTAVYWQSLEIAAKAVLNGVPGTAPQLSEPVSSGPPLKDPAQ